MPDAGRRLIAVVQTTEMACYREILRGIHTFAKAQGTWHLELFSPFEGFVRLIREWKPDGLIMGAVNNTDEAAAAIAAACGRAVGVAGQYGPRGLGGLTEIESDDEAVGRMAARHFLAKGFRHFAFLGTDANWSDLRFAGFEQAIADAGFSAARLTSGGPPPQRARGWSLPHYGHEILDWIMSLPRPLALLACNDLRGRVLAELCKSREIRVPDDVAILGVDNDDLVCELSHPPLSSVVVPWRTVGFQAARALEKRFQSRPPKPKRILVPPEGVAERQSTDTIAVGDAEVSQAVRFIRENAHKPIRVEDVLRFIPAARRSLEKKFRALLGRSPLDEIRRAHVERARQLLVQTDFPMPDVAEKSGFTSAAWFSKAFHDLTGETPTRYRQRFQCR